MLPEAAMHRLDAVPIGLREDGAPIVATVDPRNLLATDDIAMLTNRNVVPVVVTREDLDALLVHGERLGDRPTLDGRKIDIRVVTSRSWRRGRGCGASSTRARRR